MIPFAAYERHKQRMLGQLGTVATDSIQWLNQVETAFPGTEPASSLQASTPDPYAAAASGSCPNGQHIESDAHGTPVCVPSGVSIKCLPNEYAAFKYGHWLCEPQQSITQNSAASYPTFPGARSDALQEGAKRVVQQNRGMTALPPQSVVTTGSAQTGEKDFNWWWLVAGAAGLAVASVVFSGRRA